MNPLSGNPVDGLPPSARIDGSKAILCSAFCSEWYFDENLTKINPGSFKNPAREAKNGGLEVVWEVPWAIFPRTRVLTVRAAVDRYHRGTWLGL